MPLLAQWQCNCCTDHGGPRHGAWAERILLSEGYYEPDQQAARVESSHTQACKQSAARMEGYLKTVQYSHRPLFDLDK